MKEYICKHCGEKFETSTALGGHVTKEHSVSIKKIGEKRKRKSQEVYYENPKNCKGCGKVLCYDKRRNSFCSKSCAASFNNKKRVKIVKINSIEKDNHYIFLRKKISNSCKNCSKTIPKHRVFCSNSCCGEYKSKEHLKIWLRGNPTWKIKARESVREYILNEQNGKCSICGVEPFWNGKPFGFILDHIDGNSENNLRENLRLVCPICDSQLDTYKAKNKGNGRYYRKKRFQEGKSF